MSDFNLTVTLVFLTIFVMQPPSFHVQLPIIGRTKIAMNLMTALKVITLLWAVQCIRDRIIGTDDILFLFISQAFTATQNLYSYSVLTTIIRLLFPPVKKQPKRGKRMTRRKKRRTRALCLEGTGSSEVGEKDETETGSHKVEKDPEGEKAVAVSSMLPTPPTTPTPSFNVSDTILGYGSRGTVVYQGSFQGRDVAVRRIPQKFANLANHELSILQQSDDHLNVIRYYYHEEHSDFIYIALELCAASLADIIENPQGGGSGTMGEERRHIVRDFDAKRAMKQIASGLWHLHGLGLVHRDIKPQNILVSFSGRTGYRMLLSDFGLCKKLDEGQTSFLPTANGANTAGPVGWRAPEILRWEAMLDELSTGDDSPSSRGSLATYSSSGTITIRLTKSVDIFSLGCLFFYILTNGGHPYGNCTRRDANIIADNKNLSLLSSLEESTEAYDLITRMLHPEPSKRPDIQTCLPHPLFWDPAKRLSFLQEASDRFNDMCRDPKDWKLIRLERDEKSVVGSDWYQKLDPIFIENLGRYRKYDGSSVRDLMRALRNKKHHYQDLPDDVKRHLGAIPDGFLGYFTRRYPRLFMYVHEVIKDTGLDRESPFKTCFELPES